MQCKACGHKKIIYLSCGNSQCPLCQDHKRNVWQAKVSQKMLNVPYVHTVFTIPHELNKLARLNERVIYGIVMKAAWACVKKVCADTGNMGGLPGMITVLHTFGSDMKHHIHAHALITFGGMTESGDWVWPQRRKKIAPFRQMCREYRDGFIKMLKKEIRHDNIVPTPDLDETIELISHKRWNVRNGRPTMDTNVIERYLARYINRVAISKSRLKYIAHQDKLRSTVEIRYNDYRNQKKDEAAPKATRKMDPLVAIGKFMMHVLPPYLQKSRHYGLHAHQTWKKYEDKVPEKLLRNKDTIRNLFVIIKELLQLEPVACEQCGHNDFMISGVRSDPQWIFTYITLPELRGPPRRSHKSVKVI